MSRCSPAIEETLEDEFEIESTNQEDPSTILQRLKEFSYYLVENIEQNLNLCLNLLEEKPVPPKSNSIHTTVVSKSLSAIPKVGSAIGNAVSKGESFILQKIDKKNSKTLADLVYHYSDHKEDIRTVIIESAIDIFSSFECQFVKLTCDERHKKAMQKLAADASNRIFDYLLETGQKKGITRNELSKGVLYGNSNRNKAGIREGRTVIDNGVKWKTNKLYRKTGIVVIEENSFYKNKESHTEKYGYRRPLPWEILEDIKKNWERDDRSDVHHYSYSLIDGEDLIKTIRDYIMTKTPLEEAKLERENFHDDANQDRRLKHQEILFTFGENFKEILEDLEHQYELIVHNHSESKDLLKEMSEKQSEEKILQREITKKLQEIHNDINETKVLVEVHKTVQQDIADIKSENEELAKSVAEVKPENIEEMIRVETADNLSDNLAKVVRKKVRENDPGPRISREIDRNLRKIRKIW